MSSVVNKSGTRFTPKIRQRRPVYAAPTTLPSDSTAQVPTPPSTVVGESKKADEDKHRDGDENDVTDSSSKPKSPVDEADPLSNTQLEKDLNSSQTGTQLPEPASVSVSFVQRRRSSRLDSLSYGTSIFKSGFLDSQNNAPTVKLESQRMRRLSTISTGNIKKKRVSSISGSDTSFQAIKKHRMSSRSSISRKSGSAQRISIVSRLSSPEASVLPSANPSLKRESESGYYQRTDDLYQTYKISTLKELPRNIADEDSARYMIDENSFTMADLCKPLLPIGEVSDNFHRAKAASKAKMEARRKRRELRQVARQQLKPLSELSSEEQEKLKLERKKAAEEILNTDVPDEKPNQTIQLKLNQDGDMVVDEESTVVDRHRNASYENSQKERLDSNPFENLYNSSTYGRQNYTDPWTTEELVKFYKALSMWGTDFNLIAQLFPYRTRRQIKAKFVNEEKKHPLIVELALRSKLPTNFEEYCTNVQKNIGTIEEFNNKLEQLQVEHEEHLKEIEVEKQHAREQDLQQQSFKENERLNRDKKIQGGLRHDKLRAYRKSEIFLGTIDDLKKKRAEELEAGAKE
ncbi:transcription factor TFIIIB subunit BDP1 Ecym_3320 [Eremothecium cymbalariae DBVPG|uniref:SANT domain-containing protein n=1 Tax=Eremothecium cymbalariae (strain CBS 270.75 / DBVPG 7215 / KCTC 17166 / NRRL Y-17582) TaxID=931890 RepID=G8JRP2_ERECY|nr:Hypothetical protein Ecym_3320 [Eremothecium cymbalariae DBVPG\